MKKKNIIYIISAVIIVLCIIFALLIDVWASFSYFVLSLMTALTLVWAGYLIYNYLTDFKKQLDEDFDYFKAEKINSTSVTSEEFEKNELAYRKEFNNQFTRVEKEWNEYRAAAVDENGEYKGRMVYKVNESES